MTNQKTTPSKPDRIVNIAGKNVKVAGTERVREATKKVIDKYGDAIKNLENR